MTRYGYLLLLPLVACNPLVPTPLSDDVEACPAACDVLADHACPEAQPSPGGIPCPQWCADYHAAGYLKPWASCVAVTGSVDAIRACGVECK